MSDGSQPVAPGLSQSTPLVTIPVPTSISRGVAVPAGNDHPLAAPTTSGSSPMRPTNPAMMSTPTKPSAPPSQTTFTGQSNIVSTAVSPSKSLESLADSFLSEPSYRTEKLGLAAALRPVPLPREDGIERLRTLVERRAWGDVLKISTAMLNTTNGQHADVYASLVMLPLNAPHTDVSQVRPEIRNETVEIMTLQCNAWLKLRRYSDLVTEVERWNFLAHNDATAQSPEWLPWSLRKWFRSTKIYLLVFLKPSYCSPYYF